MGLIDHIRETVMFPDEHTTKELKGRRDTLRYLLASGGCGSRTEMDYEDELQRIVTELEGRKENT